jgi:hypothetical protein
MMGPRGPGAVLVEFAGALAERHLVRARAHNAVSRFGFTLNLRIWVGPRRSRGGTERHRAHVAEASQCSSGQLTVAAAIVSVIWRHLARRPRWDEPVALGLHPAVATWRRHAELIGDGVGPFGRWRGSLRGPTPGFVGRLCEGVLIGSSARYLPVSTPPRGSQAAQDNRRPAPWEKVPLWRAPAGCIDLQAHVRVQPRIFRQHIRSALTTQAGCR